MIPQNFCTFLQTSKLWPDASIVTMYFLDVAIRPTHRSGRHWLRTLAERPVPASARDVSRLQLVSGCLPSGPTSAWFAARCLNGRFPSPAAGATPHCRMSALRPLCRSGRFRPWFSLECPLPRCGRTAFATAAKVRFPPFRQNLSQSRRRSSRCSPWQENPAVREFAKPPANGRLANLHESSHCSGNLLITSRIRSRSAFNADRCVADNRFSFSIALTSASALCHTGRCRARIQALGHFVG